MITAQIQGNSANIALCGEFSKNIAKADIENLRAHAQNAALKRYIIDISGISKFDIAFLIFLHSYAQNLAQSGKSVEFVAESSDSKHILALLKDIETTKSAIKAPQKQSVLLTSLREMGQKIYDGAACVVEFLNFLGVLIYYIFLSLIKPHKIRWSAINYHIFHSVITAMPVIFIVSFVVGGVIAYQGAATLQRMGFVELSVEMTAKLTLREIGPFVVAMIVAGRSASAYTAQIGVMKMTEEIAAMKTMQLNLMDFIVLPRFLALVFSFPLMVFLSDLVSIFGCMVFLKFGFDVSFYDYIAQIKSSVGMNSFWTGIIKAPFYAAVIVVIGCFIGFRVEDNTQSVGEKTTTSVVSALFGVILINALFSLIFTELKF